MEIKCSMGLREEVALRRLPPSMMYIGLSAETIFSDSIFIWSVDTTKLTFLKCHHMQVETPILIEFTESVQVEGVIVYVSGVNQW
jgi:hypothetical protein